MVVRFLDLETGALLVSRTEPSERLERGFRREGTIVAETI